MDKHMIRVQLVIMLGFLGSGAFSLSEGKISQACLYFGLAILYGGMVYYARAEGKGKAKITKNYRSSEYDNQ